mmetsp:Transcript_2169/g.2414  ORF Transcript_2169/g.2414 Transcript_2169/m.2414 type:complete len:118 (+) Transcript_2169:542-895(+)
MRQPVKLMMMGISECIQARERQKKVLTPMAQPRMGRVYVWIGYTLALYEPSASLLRTVGSLLTIDLQYLEESTLISFPCTCRWGHDEDFKAVMLSLTLQVQVQNMNQPHKPVMDLIS